MNLTKRLSSQEGTTQENATPKADAKNGTILPLAILLSLMVTSCGPSLESQCKDIFQPMIDAQAAQSSLQGEAFDPNKSAEIMRTTATEIEGLEIGDKKLSNIRLHLVAAIRESVAASEDLTAQIETVNENFDADEPDMTRVQAAGKQMMFVQSGLQGYCAGGEIDPKLTSPPK